MTAATERLSTALADRYRIERHLGAGGMATVYLAADLKHDRKVAIKVLKPELAAVLGAERFVLEIKTTAALQHPHILPLFDSGTADGFLYYVMPFVEGETLRDKLDRETQLGVDEAVRIATEVADALHYAHERGVIHRDIKPENILLANGRPMVADFGIALAVSAAAGGRMTETGLSLGTPHYMSPEQATAEKEITRRSDIYSLASVLYEMLAGQPPHLGGSAQQIIMKIITETAATVTTLRRSVPPHVAAALAKGLEKLPADRWDTAQAFARALADPSFVPTTAPAYATAVARGGRDWRMVAMAAALALTTLTAAWALTRPVADRPVSRYSVRLPDEQSFATGFSRITLTPDGSRFIYVALGASGATELWVRERDRLDASLLAGTLGAAAPFVSPDGERVAFFANGLKVVSLRGSPPVTLTDSLVGTAGGTWSTNGFIYTDGSGQEPLVRVAAAGDRAPEWFTRLDSASGESDHIFPEALPNGKGVLFVVGYGAGGGGIVDRNIAVADTRTGAHRILVRGTKVRYARSGHLVYVTADGALMAAAFDEDAMRLTGEPVAIASDITLRTLGIPDLALAQDGTLAYTVGGSTLAVGEPVWVSRDGRAEPVAADWTRAAQFAALSPDGSRLAVGIGDATGVQLWVRELARGTASKLTFGGRLNIRPSWTPDGRSLVYISSEGGPRELRMRRADGTANSELLLTGRARAPIQEGFFTRDGRWIVYRLGVRSDGDLFARRTSGDTTSIPLATSSFGEYSAVVSPDVRWLAYVSQETAREEVYVRPFPNAAAGKWLVSSAGGTEPLWSRDGRELFYRNAKGEMVAVRVLPDATPPLGEQRVLFSASGYSADPNSRMYDVSLDGQRFLMTRFASEDTAREARLIVVENFFEELKRLVPR